MINSLRAPRNRTLQVSEQDISRLSGDLCTVNDPVTLSEIKNKVICQDALDVLPLLPSKSIDLAFIDPPYNLNKTFGEEKYQKGCIEGYSIYLDSWMKHLPRLLKPTASIYICGDWRSSTSIHIVAEKYFNVRSRISWEREKGRGAKTNWKNAMEDIWFCTMSDKFIFNLEAVKIKKNVLAPYRSHGKPKDWFESGGKKFRLTHPSNLWTDLTVPFWSMPENTDHPTQKPEKLLAKIILASSNPGDVVLDPFLGSGTTSAVAAKLDRNFIGIEKQKHYACLALKRLDISKSDKSIQGYSDGVFWERNTHAFQGN